MIDREIRIALVRRSIIRTLPENEISPTIRVDFYFFYIKIKIICQDICQRFFNMSHLAPAAYKTDIVMIRSAGVYMEVFCLGMLYCR